MKINQERLWNYIQALKRVGLQGDGSVTRYPFTKEDKEAQTLLEKWMTQAGLRVEVDAVGNVIGTLQGRNPALLPIVCGSHFDTVKQGGAFDGCLGVLAGIEVLQTMLAQGIQPLRTLQVIGFKDEEGNRFGYGMVGSKSIAGSMDEVGFSSQDSQGITLKEAMEQAGYRPAHYQECVRSMHAFFELHIEQARVLEAHEKPIGIVEGIAGLSRYTIRIDGESAHAGATPMEFRHDCVVAMSEWIASMSSYAKKKNTMVATVGAIQTYPGACNVICEYVTFSLDLRSLYDEDRERAIVWMQEYNQQLAQKHGVSITMHEEQTLKSCHCDASWQALMQRICIEENIPYQTLSSGAGHDAMNIAHICPIAMIFVRSKDGYSHRKEEYSTPQDCALGTHILYEVMCNASNT